MNTSCIVKFEQVKDILIYIACSNKEVSIYELMENVVDININAANRILKGLVKEGYLIKSKGSAGVTNFFIATDKAKQLFGLEVKDEL